MSAPRWEDLIPRWNGAEEAGEVLGHRSTVTRGPLAVGLWAAPAVAVAGCSEAAGRDLLVSCWDACFEGGVYRFPSLDDDLNVGGPGQRLPGAFGIVEPAAALSLRGMLGVSRSASEILVFEAAGSEMRPAHLAVAMEWVREPEILHVVRVCDLDQDNVWDLLIGTDSWADYWPDGREWNDPAYRPYTGDGKWRGGPLRGHVYFAHNEGTNAHPRFERARPLRCGGEVLEVYGTAAPTVGDFLGRGKPDLICGDFLDRLWFFRHRTGLAFEGPTPVRSASGGDLRLPQNIHVPVAVSHTAGSRGAAVRVAAARLPSLLVGAEDGFVHRLEGVPSRGPAPVFRHVGPVLQPVPRLHPGILPVPSVCDWTGSGRHDLLVGNGGGWLLWYPDLGGDDLLRYGEPVTLRTPDGPVRIQAGPRGSIQGPAEVKWGYLCPTVTDWDGDGRLEVLASDILGRHLLFRRDADPGLLHPPEELSCGGVPLRTVWRVRPAVADWAGDGCLRYVCLDEDGLLADYGLAPHSGYTHLADKRLLRYADGSVVAFTEDRGGGLGRVKLAVCDWTGTGRGDLLVGTHARASLPPGPAGAPRHTHGQATILLLENIGLPGQPAFARPRQIRYRGKPLQYGMHACSPEPVAWSAGGTPDLLVGTESGRVFLLRRECLGW